jgi:hypothetical protein
LYRDSFRVLPLRDRLATLAMPYEHTKRTRRRHLMRSPHCKSVPAQSQIWHTMWQCCLKWRTICKSHVKHILLYMCLICLTVFWTHGVPNTPQVKPTEDNCEAYFTQNVSNVTLVPDLQCGVPCKYILTILGLVSICTVKKIVPWGNIQFALMLYRMKLKATILYIRSVIYCTV